MRTRSLLTIVSVIGGGMIAYHYLPEESKRRLSRLPEAIKGWMLGHMPDD